MHWASPTSGCCPSDSSSVECFSLTKKKFLSVWLCTILIKYNRNWNRKILQTSLEPAEDVDGKKLFRFKLFPGFSCRGVLFVKSMGPSSSCCPVRDPGSPVSLAALSSCPSDASFEFVVVGAVASVLASLFVDWKKIELIIQPLLLLQVKYHWL